MKNNRIPQIIPLLALASSVALLDVPALGQEAAVVCALKPALPGYEIDSWEASFPELESAISTKGGVMNIFSVIMLFVAGIGILNLLMMAVFERTREIGVLGALGLPDEAGSEAEG